MPQFKHDPPTLSPPAQGMSGFVQQISLSEGKQTVAVAQWHAPEASPGVVQILELSVTPDLRRRGHGGALLRELIAQVQAFHAARKVRFRRIWLNVEQKSQVHARAFLTQHGFHHVATVEELFDHEDALVYMKSYD